MNKKDQHGKNNPNWRGGDVVKICFLCGNEYPIQRNKKKNEKTRFCSGLCASRYSVRIMLKKNKENPPLKTGRKKGIIAWNKGVHDYLSGEARTNISKANRDRIWTEEMRKKDSLSQLKPETLIKHRLSGKKVREKMNIRPTNPEKKFIEFCSKYDLPYKYTGDGSFWIEWMNPDFVNCNGEKKAIEIFGDYWHNRPGLKNYQIEEGRKRLLKKYGWDCIVIWESELKDEEKVLNKLGVLNEK